MITLQAKKEVITAHGRYKPGEVLKVNSTDAVFLIKSGAAVEIKNKPVKKLSDSPEKKEVIKKAEEEKKKAGKAAKRFGRRA